VNPAFINQKLPGERLATTGMRNLFKFLNAVMVIIVQEIAQRVFPLKNSRVAWP
jgi:hypothetical protein